MGGDLLVCGNVIGSHALIGCAPVSMMRWRDARDEGGRAALQVRFSPGRPPKLDKRQRQRLVKLLLREAMAHEYRTEIWTTARITRLIWKTFRVR